MNVIKKVARVSLSLLLALTGVLSLPVEVSAATGPGIRATFGKPVLTSAGGIDATATLERLHDMHANTYAFRVVTAGEWTDLVDVFAAAAQADGMKVWVSLYPPSECGGGTCTAPFYNGTDYTGWASEINNLALEYPVIEGWSIDDFATNLTTFTPAYVAQLTAATPLVRFYPVVYFNRLTPGLLDDYDAVVNGMIMPFNDAPYHDTQMVDTLAAQIATAAPQLAAHSLTMILMVYAYHLSDNDVVPDVDYVRQATEYGVDRIDDGTIGGVMQYQLPLKAGQVYSGDNNFSRPSTGGTGAVVFTVIAEQVTSAGDYADASTTIQLSPGSTSCLLRLYHKDNRTTASSLGYHLKQAYAGGVKIWQKDVAAEELDWYSSALLDLMPYLATGQTTLSLRLYEQAGVTNYKATVSFDDLTLTGCSMANPDFETVGGWTFSRHGGPVLVGQHLYDPAYSTTALAAVGAIYGR